MGLRETPTIQDLSRNPEKKNEQYSTGTSREKTKEEHAIRTYEYTPYLWCIVTRIDIVASKFPSDRINQFWVGFLSLFSGVHTKKYDRSFEVSNS